MKHSPRFPQSAFSLVELLSVIAILAVLASAAVATMGAGQSAVKTSVTQVASTASLARDLAITSNRRVRFAIIDGSETNPEAWRWQRYGVLKQQGLDPNASDWEMAAAFTQLPAGASFGRNEQSAGTDGQMVERTAVGTIQGKSVTYAYVEFLPNGAADTVSGANIFSLRGRSAEGGSVDASRITHVGISQHTGRVRVERPQ